MVPMRINRFLPLIGVLLLIWVSRLGYAQPEKPHFDYLTTEQGLSHHVVISVMQDRKGFLWFGTGNGLDKYDGYRFTNYKFDPRDTTSLSKNQVITLWEDSKGIIWIGTSEGTCKFDPHSETFTRLERGPSNPYAFKYAQSFNEDKEGTIWVSGSFEGELRQVDRKTGRFSSINYAQMLGIVSDSTERLYTMYRDRSGTLWLGSPTGLHRLNLTPNSAGKPSTISFTHYHHYPADSASLSDDKVAGIYEDHRGVLWVLTFKGVLNALDRKTGQFVRYPLDPTRKLRMYGLLKTSIAEDRDGNLWIGTYQDGLYHLDKNRKIITSFRYDSTDSGSLASIGFFDVLIDKSGILWGATINGVLKVDPNRKPFQLYRHYSENPHSLSQNNVAAICEDKTGVVWIGTHTGGLNALDKKTGYFTHYRHEPENPGSLHSDQVGAIIEDQAGELWVGNGVVLSRFNRQTKTFVHYPLHHPFLLNPVASAIYDIHEDHRGLFWLGTDNGMLRFDPKTGKTVNYPYDPNRPDRVSDWWVLSILEDRSGALWIGPGSQALTRFDPQAGTFSQYHYDSRKPGSISSGTVPSIYEDSQGTLWFGTGEGGLCRFNAATQTFTTFTEKQGLAGNSVFSILEDNAGNLWLGTNKGLSKFSLTTHKFTNYSADEGLQGKLFTTLYTEGAAFKGKDGTLYFGGSNGFNSFDPTKIRSNPHVPPVVITQFRLFDKLLPGKQGANEIVLEHGQNFISFEFAALNYTSPQKNQYAYQLVGLENDWVYSGTRRVASYTDLDPGTYTFRVKGSNNDGLWNNQGTSIRVIIHPPWWRTWWAYTLYGLLFIASIWAFIAYRSRALRRENRLLEEKVALRTEQLEHKSGELEHSLENLKATQTQLIQKEKMASLGELTAGIAHEIQNPLNFVNNFSEVSTELVTELEEEQQKPDRDIELEAELLGDLKQNLQKITHHGGRASAIVRGMLEHSRTNTGEKQPTDLNALADEYLRLAYQGLRTKDKTFSCELITDFDPLLGLVEVVPQEIGRVLLNLFNNAFYAVGHRRSGGPADADEAYSPTVWVSTKRAEQTVEIQVRDNGTGISDAVKAKVFQPFFTTKPTGQGTGLGLSLSYEIITKGHGGTLTVETIEAELTEFLINLPL